jgi:hypothetical protein
MRRDPRSSGGLGSRPPVPRATVAALVLGLTLVLAACGGPPDGDRVASLSGGGATTTTTGGAAKDAARDPQQAALDFARCMRQHGVDMPDPEVDDQGRIRVRVGPGGAGGGSRPDPAKLEAAQEACGGLLGGGDGDRQLDPAARDAMVAFARCMREHGIDMPDPTGDGLRVRRDGDGGPDPESAEFQEAEKACNHHLAELRRPGREAGGGS